MTAIANQRGIALVITLLVVALLTITVVEFQYSVQIDQHMSRAALNGLQASLLARSGINFGEALLLHDTNQPPNVDAFTEDWCLERGRQEGSDRPVCVIDDFSSELPADMLLKVVIADESGKFNLNAARPSSPQECTNLNNPPNLSPGTSPGTSPGAAQVRVPPWSRLDTLQRLLASRGVPTAMDSFEKYWTNACAAATAASNPTTAGRGMPTPARTPQAAAAPQLAPANLQQFMLALTSYEFTTLDDVSAGIPEFTPAVIERMRPVLAAVPSTGSAGIGRPAALNVNTAPAAVLQAVFSGTDDDCVGEIIKARADQPIMQGQGPPCMAKANTSGLQMGYNSSLFRIHASAAVHPNPITGRGGISRTASMLVWRSPYLANPPSGMGHYILRQLDWQKEGGGALFLQQGDHEPGIDGEATPGAPGFGG